MGALHIIALLAFICAVPLSAQDSAKDCPVDIVFVVDRSGSICNNDWRSGEQPCENWKLVLRFLQNIVSDTEVGDTMTRFALVIFGNDAKLIFDLKKYNNKKDIMDAISEIKYKDEKTFTAAGIRYATEHVLIPAAGDRIEAENVIIVVTDGKSSENSEDPIRAAEDTRALGNRVIAVGVTESADMDEVKAMSSAPHTRGQDYFKAVDFSVLKSVLKGVVNAACTARTTTAAPTTTTPTTTAIIQGKCKADLLIIIDRSGSICNDSMEVTTCPNWEKVLNAVKMIVRAREIGVSQTLIAVISFGTEVRLEFNLNQGTTKSAVLDFIDNIKYVAGKETHTHKALEYARLHIFKKDNGDRDGIDNTVILLTDGKSTQNPLPAAALLREKARIIVIGVEHPEQRLVDSQIQEIKGISSYPHALGSDYFMMENFDQLMSMLDKNMLSNCYMPTTPATETDCPYMVDVVFIVDASGSVKESNFRLTLDYIVTVIGVLGINSGKTRVALITFDQNVNVVFKLDAHIQNRDAVAAAVQTASYTHGSTNTAEALRYASQQMFQTSAGGRSDADHLIFIITDGGSDDKETTVKEALAAKARGVHIVTMGIGDLTDTYELKAIASYPKGNYWHVDNYAVLPSYVSKAENLICKTGACDGNKCVNGGACKEFFQNAICICVPPFGGPTCNHKCRIQSDVVIALDSSGSIGHDNFVMMTDFARDLVMELPIEEGGTRVALETFSTRETIHFHLKEYEDRLMLMNAISLLYLNDGTTNTAAALLAMTQDMFRENQGDRPDRPNVGLLITDGHSNNELDAWRASMRARDAGIALLAVGVGRSADREELRGIVSAPSDKNLFMVDDFERLADAKEKVRDAICRFPDPCLSHLCEHGGLCKATVNGYICICIDNYSGPRCAKSCSGKADIVFAVDVSGSIRHERFSDVKEFLVDVISQLIQYPNTVRIGAISFDTEVKTEFYLNQFKAQQDTIQAIRRMAYRGGLTNIAGAIERAREQIFRAVKGDRTDVPNYLIIFTDATPTVRELDTIPAAVAARVAGIHIVLVGVGDNVNELEMLGMASAPQALNMMTVARFAQINSLVSRVVGALCDDVDECQSNPCQNGAACWNGLKQYICKCSLDYVGRTCDRTCRRRHDVVFLLDFSGSVDTLTNMVVAFTIDIVYGLPFANGFTRVGVASYSDDVNVAFNLNRYSTQRDVLNAISFSQFGGRTHTAAALRKARDSMLSVENGRRDGVRGVVVLVTDGESNVNAEMTQEEARRLRDTGVVVIVIAVGDRVGEEEASEMASPNRMYRVRERADVPSVARTVLDRMCN